MSSYLWFPRLPSNAPPLHHRVTLQKRCVTTAFWWVVAICQIGVLCVGTYYAIQEIYEGSQASSAGPGEHEHDELMRQTVPPWAYYIMGFLIVVEVFNWLSSFLKLVSRLREWGAMHPWESWGIKIVHILQIVCFLPCTLSTFFELAYHSDGQFFTAVTGVVAYSFILTLDDPSLEDYLRILEKEAGFREKAGHSSYNDFNGPVWKAAGQSTPVTDPELTMYY